MARPNSKAKLGEGGRFAALRNKIAARGDVRDPGAVAAAIGRKKYGKAKFQNLAAAGKRSAHGSGAFTAAEQASGYKVLCTASDLNKMDVDRRENVPDYAVLASRRESNAGGHTKRRTFRRSESTKGSY